MKFTGQEDKLAEKAEKYENLSERELTNRAARGEEAAFAEIVRRFSPRVFRVAARFFRPPELIEEAAQEIFLKAFVQIGNFQARGSLEGWLTRIAVTTCINLLRTAKRQPELTVSDIAGNETAWLEEKLFDASADNFQKEADRLIAADLIDRVLQILPPEERVILTMIDGAGESVRDVAKIFGWSESKVKIKAFRARRKIREKLQNLLRIKN